MSLSLHYSYATLLLLLKSCLHHFDPAAGTTGTAAPLLRPITTQVPHHHITPTHIDALEREDLLAIHDGITRGDEVGCFGRPCDRLAAWPLGPCREF